MEKIHLVVENTFINSLENNKTLGLTVFDRVFNKLKNQDGSLGKVHPIYLKTQTLEKTIGILTLNESGSYSLFLELPGETEFDHLTFNKNLQKDNHHYTHITKSGRKKMLPISAQHLTNGTYHVVTIVIRDHSLLKGIPKEVHYPEVAINKLYRIEEAFLTSGNPEGSTILTLDGNSGSICLQLFLIPKSVAYKQMALFLQPFENVQSDFKLDSGIRIQNYILPHEQNDEYSLGIISFLYNKQIDTPFYILTSAKREGFYSKIRIKNKLK